MQTTDKLTGLIEQAASAIKTLSAADVSELENLQEILDKIKQNISELSDSPAQMLEQFQGTTQEAVDALQEIFQKEAEDTAKSVEIISQAVQTLQSLGDEISKEVASPETTLAETNLSPDTKTASQEPVEAEAKEEAEAEAKEEAEAEVEEEAKAEVEEEAEAEVKEEAEAEVEEEAETEVKEEAEAEVKEETEAEVKEEVEAEAKEEETESEAKEDVEAKLPELENKPDDETDAAFILDFVTEADEHIESAEAGLLELENKPEDKEVINQIFRGFHTIKGLAAFLNLTDIGQLAHSAENLLDLVRKGELHLAGENIDAVFESIDMMKKLIADLEQSVKIGTDPTPQKQLPQLLEKLRKLVEDQDLATSLKSPQAQKQDEKLDKILTKKEEPKTQDITTQTQTRTSDEKIKVSTTRLDNLVNMVGELVVAQLMVSEEVNTKQMTNHNLCRKVAHQNKIIRELQQLSMSIRMVPIGGVFQKMARLVRDLSRKSGKEINFITRGDETELDRTVVDKIADPLVHMIRNAIDHGIEPVEERKEAGKNPKGQIELRAFHEAGNIVIEIEDDGKGLSKENILKKAIDNGIVTPEQELNDDEILKLIFHAGLSTAQKVTSVSGRGVGMDVVKKNVEALHGRIDINSTPGKGTIFTIRMPLTLAIIDGQIIRVGNNRFIIPINSIAQSLRPNADTLSSVHNRGEMAMVQGKLMPIIRLYRLFGVVPSTEDPTESLLVIVEDNGQKCCLLVDELLGQQQVVIKSLGEGLGKVTGISGGAIMGDGRVSLILDIAGIIELAQQI